MRKLTKNTLLRPHFIFLYFLLGLQALSPILELHSWPWSKYPMYAYILKPQQTYIIQLDIYDSKKNKLTFSTMEQRRLTFLLKDYFQKSSKFERIKLLKYHLSLFKKHGTPITILVSKKQCLSPRPFSCGPFISMREKVEIF